MVFLTLFAKSSVEAQQPFPRHGVGTLVAGNAVIGGLTAALQAKVTGKPAHTAFLAGMLGGAIHGSGKMLSPNAPLPGIALSSLGTSVVANAGRGVGLLHELTLPVGPARIRVTTGLRPRVSASLNVFESVTLAERLARPELSVDWNRSLQSGTFVLRSSEQLYGLGGLRAAGLTKGTTITLSPFASHPEETFAHERIHVQQEWFVQEVWGRPLENGLRSRIGVLRWIPGWLELGGLSTGLLKLERRTMGWEGPYRTMRESEAESLEDRGRP